MGVWQQHSLHVFSMTSCADSDQYYSALRSAPADTVPVYLRDPNTNVNLPTVFVPQRIIVCGLQAAI